MRGRLISGRWNRLRGKPIWRWAAWSLLLLLVVGGVVAPFFLPPGFGDWSMRESKPLIAAVTSVAFSPDGALLAAGGRDGTVRLWEAATGQLRQTLHAQGEPVFAVVFSPDGALLAAGSEDGTVRLWEAATGQLRQALHARVDPVWGVAFSPDGTLLAAGNEVPDGTVRLWEVASGQLHQTLRAGELDTVWGVAFSPDGALLAAGGSDNTVRLWEVATGQLLRTLRAQELGAVLAVAFSPDGALLAAGGQDATVRLWDAETGKLTLSMGAPTQTVAVSTSGRWVATGHQDGTVHVWEATTGRHQYTFRDDQVAITCVAFSQGDDWVVIWDQNGNVRSREVETGTALAEAPPAGPKQCPPTTSGRFSFVREGQKFLFHTAWAEFQFSSSSPWLGFSTPIQHAILIPHWTVADILWGRFRFVVIAPRDFASVVIASFQPQVPLLLTELVLFFLLLAPATVWMGTRAVRQRRLRQHVLRPALHAVQRCLEQAGATVRRVGERSLRVVTAPARLTSFVPLPVLLAADTSGEADVTELVQQAERFQGKRLERAGVLVYREAPDTLVRLRMAEVRLRDHMALIPIPLAEVEQALRDDACAGLLEGYTSRYLPGADLFDDRLAISDTLAFFGRTQLLHRLQEDLIKLQGIGLFGLRKSGKTSVLLQLGFALRHHPVVRCDLQFYGEKPRYGGEVFNAVLQQLAALVAARRRRLVPRFTPFPPDLPASQVTVEFARRVSTFAEALQRVGYALPILCFLDEVERILPARTDPREKVEEFNACLGALRALSQEQRVLALLVTDVHPDCNRINHWAHEGVASNPVYSFFKEVFLPPFTEVDTTIMLTDLGRFMGREFDGQTLQAIHHESGGHPYVARQFASLVCARVPVQGEEPVTWAVAQRYLESPFMYSGVLKNYCEESIWGDLQKRNFTSAMAILRLLTCTEAALDQVTEATLQTRLSSMYTESQWLDALLWLEAVGLVGREEAEAGECYRLRMPLLGRWLRMQMGAAEVRQWQGR